MPIVNLYKPYTKQATGLQAMREKKQKQKDRQERSVNI